jgi:hypothetical protein
MNYLSFLAVHSLFLFGILEGSTTTPKGDFFDKSMVFQPQFLWADHSCTQQGTGSLIKGPNGSVIGLTSAHFINFNGPQLLEVQWLDVRTGKPIARSLKSYGMPGHEGSYDPLDLKSDYFLLLVEDDLETQKILEIDNRNSAELGERVWFPDKRATANLGYHLIGGTLTKVNTDYLLITLDDPVNLQSRSGTPIISQYTGKILGILVGGETRGNKTFLYITPGLSILKALVEAQNCFLLRDVVGHRYGF